MGDAARTSFLECEVFERDGIFKGNERQDRKDGDETSYLSWEISLAAGF